MLLKWVLGFQTIVIVWSASLAAFLAKNDVLGFPEFCFCLFELNEILLVYQFCKYSICMIVNLQGCCKVAPLI